MKKVTIEIQSIKGNSKEGDKILIHKTNPIWQNNKIELTRGKKYIFVALPVES